MEVLFPNFIFLRSMITSLFFDRVSSSLNAFLTPLTEMAIVLAFVCSDLQV